MEDDSPVSIAASDVPHVAPAPTTVANAALSPGTAPATATEVSQRMVALRPPPLIHTKRKNTEARIYPRLVSRQCTQVALLP
jgi:hypothetical protein